MSFKAAVGLGMGGECLFQDKIRLFKPFLHIPAFHFEVFGRIVFDVVMDLGGAVFHRLDRIEYAIQFFQINLD